MSIYDCIMFAGELDMLMMRLHELHGKVDYHIIVEAPYTHRGYEKPLHFAEHILDFQAWRPKITYVIADGLSSHKEDPKLNPWVREHRQRDAALTSLKEKAQRDDIILIADTDELPSDEALAWDGNSAVALKQRTFHSSVEWEYPAPEYTSVIARASYILARSLSEVRDGRYSYPVIENGGWHFSWIGTQEDRKNKLDRATCHLDMPSEEWSAIATGVTYERGQHYAPDAHVQAVTVDDSWPDWIHSRKCPESWFRPRINK